MSGNIVTITIDAEGGISVDTDPIETVPDKHVVFVIQNDHDSDHRVSVSPFNFAKKAGSAPGGPDHPVHIFAKFWDDVAAGDVGAFILHVKDKGDFGGDRDPDQPVRHFQYKYTISATDLPDLDPGIEINN